MGAMARARSSRWPWSWRVAGCAGAPHRHDTLSPPGGLGVCRLGQLGAAFGGVSQPGTGGTALGIIGVWNKSPVACRLPGPVVVAALDAAGRRITTAVRLTIAPRQFTLTRDGRQPDQRGRTPAGQLLAWLVLEAAGIHHRGTFAGSCHGHQVDPAAFTVTLSSGGPVTVPNASAARGLALTRDGGLLTCQGRLAGQSPISITRSWPVAVPAAPPSVAPPNRLARAGPPKHRRHSRR